MREQCERSAPQRPRRIERLLHEGGPLAFLSSTASSQLLRWRALYRFAWHLLLGWRWWRQLVTLLVSTEKRLLHSQQRRFGHHGAEEVAHEVKRRLKRCQKGNQR